ncbi:hypothetical protein M885DRAFT_245207 [Pelagophyceae sp. CCMP2097]|nr:hypothetical protein M885DRAFT_245207 [Pelagophyceae sp. CCMP2097]
MPRDEVEARLQWLSWPDLERFTDLLKKESLFRLGLLGPSFADSIKAEARWRRTLYRRWIDFVDGEGLFPPNKQALRDDEFAFGLPQYATEETKEAYQALKAQHVQVLEAKQQLAEWSRKAQARAKLADGDRPKDQELVVRDGSS